MFKFAARASQPTSARPTFVSPELLEARTLFAAAPFAGPCPPPATAPAAATAAPSAARAGPANKLATVAATVTTVEAGTLSEIVRAGLESLAQGVAIPDAQAVKVTSSADGSQILSYSTVVTVAGVESRIAVDANGDWLEGKVALSATPQAVQDGLKALNANVDLPAAQLVQVSTGKSGATLFTTAVTVAGVASQATVDVTGTAIARDGRNCGAQTTVAFGTLSPEVQAALTSLSQGVTIDAAQLVRAYAKPDGGVVYSTVISVNGAASKIAVDGTGKLLQGSLALSATPTEVQAGLNALATTAAGTPTILPATQLVKLNARRDGSVVYSTAVTNAGVTTVLSVDATGAAVTAPPAGPGKGGPRGGGGRR